MPTRHCVRVLPNNTNHGASRNWGNREYMCFTPSHKNQAAKPGNAPRQHRGSASAFLAAVFCALRSLDGARKRSAPTEAMEGGPRPKRIKGQADASPGELLAQPSHAINASLLTASTLLSRCRASGLTTSPNDVDRAPCPRLHRGAQSCATTCHNVGRATPPALSEATPRACSPSGHASAGE